MVAGLLFFIVVVGFVCRERDPLFRIRDLRHSGHRLYLRYAWTGMRFFAMASAIYLLSPIESLVIPFASEFFRSIVAAKLATIDLIALVLALVVAEARRVATKKLSPAYGARAKLRRAMRLKISSESVKGDELAEMLMKASRESFQVLVTLQDRKVYVGTVQRFDPGDYGPHSEWIKIIARESGYRDDQTQKVIINTIYEPFLLKAGLKFFEDQPGKAPADFLKFLEGRIEDYESIAGEIPLIEERQLTVVLPIAYIQSVHPYSPGVHKWVGKLGSTANSASPSSTAPSQPS